MDSMRICMCVFASCKNSMVISIFLSRGESVRA